MLKISLINRTRTNAEYSKSWIRFDIKIFIERNRMQRVTVRWMCLRQTGKSEGEFIPDEGHALSWFNGPSGCKTGRSCKFLANKNRRDAQRISDNLHRLSFLILFDSTLESGNLSLAYISS
mgnify:CR=1 FL=1